MVIDFPYGAVWIQPSCCCWLIWIDVVLSVTMLSFIDLDVCGSQCVTSNGEDNLQERQMKDFEW